MSWSASGKANEDGLALNVVPPEDSLGEAAKAQFSFMEDFVRNAFAGGHLEGAYNVSLYGHANDVPSGELDRRTLGFSLSPIKLEVEAPAEASDSP